MTDEIVPGFQVGVATADAANALVTVEHRADGTHRVSGVESLSTDLRALVDRLTVLAQVLDRPQYWVDADGSGNALWELAGFDDWRDVRGLVATRYHHDDRAPLGVLYEGLGVGRQALLDPLLVAYARPTLVFAKDLPGMDLMERAMAGFSRKVKEDGLVGPPLVTALCLALQPRLVAPRLMAFVA